MRELDAVPASVMIPVIVSTSVLDKDRHGIAPGHDRRDASPVRHSHLLAPPAKRVRSHVKSRLVMARESASHEARAKEEVPARAEFRSRRS